MSSFNFQVFEKKELEELIRQLWGTNLKEDVFSRWSQGFIFSEASSAALVQFEGGPCAVIAPVQAFIIKHALFGHGTAQIEALTTVSGEEATNLLLESLTEILSQIDTDNYVIVSLEEQTPNQPHSNCDSSNTATELSSSSHSKQCFHEKLRFCRCSNVTDLKNLLRHILPLLQSSFGVLLYLYSLLLTKSLEQIRNEVEDPSEALIDGIHGHGSQSLINLLLTSHAVSNVWDNDKEISGLKLRGLLKQPTIGFLTILEHMRYCEVGWYYKNPKFPVWLLGSETHLTVLFSTTENLVIKDSPGRNANLVFAQFDTDGNGFVSSAVLEDLLKALDLVSEKEYVAIMRSKLDAEELGIITRASFMQEFFPEDSTEQVQSFVLYHHNALPQSSVGGKVVFVDGKAKLANEIETQFITDTTPMALCLQTKWPSIEVNWSSGTPPSLN